MGGYRQWIRLKGIEVKKVLIVLGDSYIANGVVSLLSEESDITVESTIYVQGCPLTETFDKHHPDVLILDENLLSAEQTYLSNLLINHPNMKIVVLSLHDNRVSVFHRSDLLISTPQDFISAIKSGLALELST